MSLLCGNFGFDDFHIIQRIGNRVNHFACFVEEGDCVCNTRIYCVDNLVSAVKSIFFPNARVVFFCRNCRSGNRRVIQVVGQYVANLLAACLEGYGVIDCRIYCINDYVARRQGIAFPYARVVRFFGNCGFGNFFIVNRIDIRTYRFAVCLKGYGIFAQLIYRIDNLIAAVKGVRFPITAVAFLCRNSRSGNRGIIQGVRQYVAYLYAVCHEGYGVIDRRFGVNRFIDHVVFCCYNFLIPTRKGIGIVLCGIGRISRRLRNRTFFHLLLRNKGIVLVDKSYRVFFLLHGRITQRFTGAGTVCART